MDGELIIWDQARGRTSFADLQRRVTAGPRLVRLVREHPANYVLFDLLADPNGVLLGRPLAERRGRLERLLENAPPGLQLCPQTHDLSEAHEWMRTWPAAGVEGVVAKRLNSRYEPGRRRWCKLRVKTTTEAIIGGVTGTVSDPETLLLGRHDLTGRLRYVGRTHTLTASLRRELSARLTRSPQRRAGGVDHPWPQPLPPSWSGQLERSEPLPYVQVEPDTVIEIQVDTAYEHTRWRHRVQAIGYRAELSVFDVPLIGAEDPA
ncbi:hypothetical protein Pa4123_41090 [Phytohabitans aurantiacus]|uniref:DNA ligase (ATP) n=1 Tax=Phytohabitans aurantiacus TaxID=3016789 RepID=A0ABQ5QYR4_9ACTN|nr:hypothetical protein Pa4123_41090 [Phytohabitans aurantiacus]